MRTRLTEAFAIRYPILCAPMALVAGGRLAIDALRGTPWPEEFSFRVVENEFTREWAHREREAADAFGSLASLFAEARSSQNFDVSPIVAGEAVGLFRDRPSAAAIVEAMVQEAESLLGRGATLDFTARPASGSR